MAKRFIDSEIWDKEWYMQLPCKEKCLVNMVRSKADLCGVWSPNWTAASMYIGEKVSESDLLKIDDGKQFKKIDNGKIYCIGFIEFQYGELSEKSPVHRKIIGLLTQNGLLNNYKEIGLKYPINRVQEEEEEKDKEKEEDKEKDRQTEKLLIPEMISMFKKSNSNYPVDAKKDYPSLLKIFYFMSEKAGFERDVGKFKEVLPYWEQICTYIQKDNFFKNYSISQVEKHIQSIVLKIQNEGTDSNPKSNKPITGNELEQAHAKRFGGK